MRDSTAALPGLTALSVSLVQLSGEHSIRYTPLAMMNISAAALADPRLEGRVRLTLHDFLQAHTLAEMLDGLLAAKPDVLAFSCQGWNFRQLIPLFPALKQYLPQSIVLLGGNHVTGRGEVILPAHPAVDLLGNGEGERIVPPLLAALLDGEPLDTVPGLSFRRDGRIVTTAAPEPVRDLEEYPSPYAQPGLSLDGYDVAMLETNRGCPYRCGYCFWGGRVGSKLARSRLERVSEDLERIGQARIEGLFLCDANFGILKDDEIITDMVIDTYRRYGAPREFNVNWAKNKADRVAGLIRRIIDAGIHTAINIPMQTNSPLALSIADRGDAGRDAMMEECRKLVADGFELYCEMIFGLPGESLDEFKRNYDIVFRQFPVLRIHPLWILPNTEFDRRRVDLGLRTLSPDPFSDYEAVTAHNQMTADDTRDGLAMLLSHSILVLLRTARGAMHAYAYLAQGNVADALVALEGFLAGRPDDLAVQLGELYERLRRVCYFERSLRDRKRQLLYASREETEALVKAFVATLSMPGDVRELCLALVEFDCMLLPRSDLEGSGFVESSRDFAFDPVAVSQTLARGETPDLTRAVPTRVVVRHKAGMGILKGRNCDLTGAWNGKVERVVALQPGELSCAV